VKEILHKAFWEILRTELESDPPQFKQVRSGAGQCCGSMTFWCGSGSGSADPCLSLMDPVVDSDPAIFVIDLQDANKKRI
jgi:hypothetical protein